MSRASEIEKASADLLKWAEWIHQHIHRTPRMDEPNTGARLALRTALALPPGAALTAEALDAARAQGRREGVEQASVMACAMIRRWLSSDDADQMRLALRSLLPSPSAADTGTRETLDVLDRAICDFGKRIGYGDKGEVELRGHMSPSVWIPAKWSVRWRRDYRGVASDWREVEADSLPEAIAAANAWEDENDRKEPQHAPPSAAGDAAKETT